MLKWRVWGVTVAIRIWFPILCLYMLYTDPSGFVLTALAAAFLHECGHLGAMIGCGVIPETIIVSLFGIRFEWRQEYVVSFEKEIVIAACGPFLNLLAACLLIGRSPTASLVHTSLGVMNLLPLYPLDGERIVRNGIRIFTAEETADRWLNGIFWCLWPLLCVASVAVMLTLGGNPSMMILSLYVGTATLLKEYGKKR